MKYSKCYLVLILLFMCCCAGYAIQDDSAGRGGSLPPKPPVSGPKPGTKRPGGGRGTTNSKAQPRSRGSAQAELTINATLVGCQVLLDGQPRGMTNAGGVLVIPSLKTGSHKVLLRKPGYRDEERVVTLSSGSNMQNFFLTPLPGSLIITPDVAGARIVIQNVGEYMEKVNTELAPGSYEISITKPGYRTVTRGVTITAGQPFNLPVALEKISVEELLAQARASYDQQNYNTAISLASILLATQPEHAKANALIGVSMFSSGNYADSLPYMLKAMTLGESISFPVKHRHGGSWAGKSLCSGNITLSPNTFEFHSTDYVADHFRIPYSKISEMAVKDEIRLFTKVAVIKPDGKEGERGYDFYSTDANAQGRMVYCSSCLPQMRVIIQLMRQFKERR